MKLGEAGPGPRRAVAHREQERDAAGGGAAGGEQQRVRRLPVEPLRVVDQDERRSARPRPAEQRQQREPDQEPVGGVRPAEAERRAERRRLRAGQPPRRTGGIGGIGGIGRGGASGAVGGPGESGGVDEVAEQEVQGREGDVGLALDAAPAQDAHPGRAVRGVVEERGLADPGLAAQDQGSAAGALLRPPHQVFDLGDLGHTPAQRLPHHAPERATGRSPRPVRRSPIRV